MWAQRKEANPSWPLLLALSLDFGMSPNMSPVKEAWAWGEKVGTRVGSKGGGGVRWDEEFKALPGLHFLAASTTSSQGRCTGWRIQRG